MIKKLYPFDSNRNDYLTPPELISDILSSINQDKFFADVCCSRTNIPAMFHAIKGRADGLNVSWHWLDYGLNESDFDTSNLWVYCNPPFDTCRDWVKKAYKEQKRGVNSILLIPARTETKFWHDYILNENGFGFREGIKVKFLRKGICFLDPDTGECIKMERKLKDKDGNHIIDEVTGEHAFELVDGVYKNALAIVYFIGRK